MNITLIAIILLLSLGCSSVQERPKAYLPTVNVICPNGHHSVRKVPVYNGLIGVSNDLQKKVDRYEVVLGGCTGTESTTLVCSKCGFRFDAMLNRWERMADDPESFHPLINDELRRVERSFSHTGYHYFQDIGPGDNLTESVVLYCHDEIGAIRQRLNAFANELRMKPWLVAGDPKYITWRSDDWNWRLEFIDITSWKDSRSSMISMTHNFKGPNQAPTPGPDAPHP